MKTGGGMTLVLGQCCCCCTLPPQWRSGDRCQKLAFQFYNPGPGGDGITGHCEATNLWRKDALWCVPVSQWSRCPQRPGECGAPPSAGDHTDGVVRRSARLSGSNYTGHWRGGGGQGGGGNCPPPAALNTPAPICAAASHAHLPSHTIPGVMWHPRLETVSDPRVPACRARSPRVPA